MRSFRRRLRRIAASGAAATAVALTALPGAAGAAPLTDGNLVVYRVGTGAAALSSAATPVFLDEYTPAGTLVQSIALPTAATGLNKATTASGTATSEGFLTRSVDGCAVLYTGYNVAPGTPSVSGTAASAVNRVVGKLDGSGVIDTSTALTNVSDGNNVRSVASTDPNRFWVGGAGSATTGGANFVAAPGATTGTQLSASPANVRQVAIFDGQLFASAQSGTTRLATVGSGLPTTAGQTITNLPGAPAGLSSPYGFFFADRDGVPGLDTLYVADDGAGAVLKYELSGGTWVARGQQASIAARGLTGVANAGGVTLYVTRNANQLDKIQDLSAFGNNMIGVVTPLATAATNTAFRGVAFAPRLCGPDPVIPEAHYVVLLPLGAAAVMGAAYLVLRPRGTRAPL